MKKTIALPPFLPDQSINSGVMLKAENVYPAVDGYRPVGGFQDISDALPDTFAGGNSFIASDGSTYLYAATASNLYKFGAGAWTSVASGFTAQRWRFQQFGDYGIAVNGGVTQEINLLTGTAGALAGAPAGTSVAVVGDYIVIGGAEGNRLRVQWSGFNDRTDWDGSVTGSQAGFQPMLTGGEVMGVAGGEYGIILQRFRLVRMERTGDPDAAFSFYPITPNFGCASKASIAQAGTTIFFLSDRGFMALENGQELRPIGSEKVDRTFSKELSRDNYERLFSFVDPQNKLVMWGIPGTPGTIWVYNFELDKWSTIKANFTGLFDGYTSSQTLEELSADFPDLDAMPYSLDDPRFSGGDPRLFIVNSGNEVGVLTGPNLEADLDLGYQNLIKGRRTRLRHVRPITDAVDGITLRIDAVERLGDMPRKFATSNMVKPSGIMPLRVQSRYMSACMNIAAGTDWDYVQGMEIDYEAGGER